MLSCCPDLDVLDTPSHDGYTDHDDSFKVVGSFVHPRQEWQTFMFFKLPSILPFVGCFSPEPWSILSDMLLGQLW